MKKLLNLCAVFVVWSRAAAATPVAIPDCRKPDSSFGQFLKRFEDVAAFRRSRLELPLVSRQGDGVTASASIALWTSTDIASLKDPLIYSQAQRRKAGLIETIPLLQPRRYAEVFQQNAGEADDTRLLYKFRSLQGCWVLEEVDDWSQ